MQRSVTILGCDLIVDYDYEIAYRGCPAHMGNMNYPGHPAEGTEFEITVTGIAMDEPSDKPTQLEMPAWLQRALEEHLQDDDKVYDDIVQDDANAFAEN